jgi:outer membrane protein TolC
MSTRRVPATTRPSPPIAPGCAAPCARSKTRWRSCRERARADDARIAVEGYEASYRAAEARFRGGMGSLFELEDARRTALQAQSQSIDLQRERVAAWIALYRALGGGWDRDVAATSGPVASQ